MSYIFDALQKSETERSGIDSKDPSVSELLEAAERQAAAQTAALLADPGTELSSPREPEEVLQPLQNESEGEGARLEPHTLEIDETQRDELMRLIQQVFLLPGAKAPRTVVLTGVEPGNGCSWVCCRVAAVLSSQLSDPICIVDANLRSPGLHQMFGVTNHHGLSDALQTEESIRKFVHRLGSQNLWLLSCGANATDRRTALSSDRMLLRLAELRKYFKYVLIDSPALSRGQEGIILGGAAEGVVLVLKANSARRETTRKVVQDLQNAGVRILGAVLNQRTFPIPQAIYNRL